MAGLMQAYLGHGAEPLPAGFHRADRARPASRSTASTRPITATSIARPTPVAAQTFDETYAGFKKLLIGAWHRDALAREEEAA